MTIYFIGEAESIGRKGAQEGRANRAFKIGYTSAPDAASRLAGIQSGNPRKLKIHLAIPGTDREEKRLHVFLHHYRLAGEWFLLSPAFARALRREHASLDDLMERIGEDYAEHWLSGGWFVYPENRPPPLPPPTPLTEEQRSRAQRFAEESWAYRAVPNYYNGGRRR